MYAIRHKHSHRWLYETDFQHDPPIQKTSFFQAKIFPNEETANYELRRRLCSKHFEVVKVRLDVAKTINTSTKGKNPSQNGNEGL